MMNQQANLIQPDIFAIIVEHSAYLYGVGMFISFLSTLHIYSGDVALWFAPDFIIYIQNIYHNTTQITTLVSSLLQNPVLDQAMLAQVHQLVTPYIISTNSIWFNVLVRIMNLLDVLNYHHFDQADQLFLNLRSAANNLLEVYRNLEGLLNIPIDQSPVTFQINIRQL